MEDKKFNPAKRKKLNNPQRLRYIPAEKIVEILGQDIKGNMADYGAGTGFLTYSIAELYPDSRIFAIDIEEQMIEEMLDNSDSKNVYPLQIEDNEMPFAANDLSAVWSIAVLHEMKTPQKWLNNAYKTLKVGAKLLIIDWSVDQNPEIEAGPPISHRIKVETVMSLLQNVGFKDVRTYDGFKNHFAVSGEK